MTDRELVARLEAHRVNAVGFFDDEIATEQKIALDYYMGEPFGDEEAGRSQVISRDVAEVVDWMMPDLMRIFASGDRVVEFKPRNAGDEAAADQATDYINYIFWKDNDGFRVLFDWFKDALIQKNGFVKVWWCDAYETEKQIYDGLSVSQLVALEEDSSIEILEHDEEDVDFSQIPPQLHQLFSDGKRHSVAIRHTKPNGRIVIESIPPEEILVAPRTKCLKDSTYVCHRTEKPLSDLVAEDLITKKQAESLHSQDRDAEERKTDRHRGESEFDETEEKGLEREVWVYEEYFREDGVLKKVIRVSDEILYNEETDCVPIVTITPNPMPHRVYGRATADDAKDLQRVKSVIWRQSLDNLYLSNNPEKVINDQLANENTYEDSLDMRVGKLVRVDGPPGEAIQYMAVPFVGRQSFQMLEYADSVLERRTGITRLNQGLDTETLNETASGQARLMAAAQGRKELIARIFAQGLAEVFSLVLKYVRQYQDFNRVIRLRDQWVPVDPRTWNAEFDVDINVGIGTGNKEQKAAALMQVLALQKEGIAVGMSDPAKLYNTATDLLTAFGLTPSRHFIDPSGPNYKPPEQQPSEAEIKAQTDIQIAQIKAQSEMQIAREKLAQERELRMYEMRMEAELTGFKVAADSSDRKHENTNISRG